MWFNVTDLAPPQRNQVGALITALINTNRQARGRELLLNQVQPISFHTKQPPSAPHKPQVSSYTSLWHSHVPTLARNKPECVLQVNLAHLAAPGGDQLQAQPLPSTSQAGLAVYTNPPAVPPAIPPKQQTAPPPHITHVVPLTRQNVDKYVAKQKGGEHAFEWCVHVHSFCHIAEPDARVRAAEVRAGHTEAVEEGDVRAQSRHTAAGAKRVGAVRGQGRATAHANISADIIAPRPRRRAHTRQKDMDATRRRSRATIHELGTINMDTSTNTHSSNSTKHTSSRGLVSASCHKCRT